MNILLNGTAPLVIDPVSQPRFSDSGSMHINVKQVELGAAGQSIVIFLTAWTQLLQSKQEGNITKEECRLCECGDE